MKNQREGILGVVVVVPSLSESFTVAERVRTTPTLTRWNSQECFIGPKNYTYTLARRLKSSRFKPRWAFLSMNMF